MTLTHAIATILLQADHTGYEISKEFDEKVSCYWQATSQQIYRELGKMQEQGLVRAAILPQTGRPDKKIYALTDQGREELIHWIMTPSEPTAVREGLLVKVRSGFIVPPEILVTEIRRRQQMHQQKLSYYHSLETQFTDISEPSQKHLYLTLRCGIRYETMWVEWCSEAIALLTANSENLRS